MVAVFLHIYGLLLVSFVALLCHALFSTLVKFTARRHAAAEAALAREEQSVSVGDAAPNACPLSTKSFQHSSNLDAWYWQANEVSHCQSLITEGLRAPVLLLRQ